MMIEEYDYIIIGSGFGGSVSALRLSEKGYRVLVLEKGKEFKDQDFAKTNWDLRKSFWFPVLKCFGILKLTFFRKIFILSGVGVGGGSLVYANTLMVPPKAFFENKAWGEFKAWEKVLSPYYEIAKKMLGVTRNPWTNKEDLILKEIAKDLGRESEFSNVDVGVYFGDPEKAVDPYFNGEGPLRQGCTGCAGCMTGCRYNAKNTLVKNYLYFARKKGAQLLAETHVDRIEYIDGKYIVNAKSSTSFFRKQRKAFKSKGIVCSGGVLGTMDLLLKQKYKYQTLTRLSDYLGYNVRTNSEMLCGVTTNEKMNHGVAISSVMNPDADTHVEIVKYPNASNALKLLAIPASIGKSPTERLIKITFSLLKEPSKYFRFLMNKNWAENSIIFLVMQTLDSKVRMSFKHLPFFHLTLKDEGEKIPAYIESGAKVMDAYAKKVNGITQSVLPEVLFNIPSTAHILGGAPMGDSPLNGLVNSSFEVFNYPNMYICDGSMIQCNLGVNPSLTITALTEYAMDQIPSFKSSL